MGGALLLDGAWSRADSPRQKPIPPLPQKDLGAFGSSWDCPGSLLPGLGILEGRLLGRGGQLWMMG